VETFADNNDLYSDVTETFSEAGFRNLFEFQEDSIEAVREDHHTLLTAATGRGRQRVG